jgi:hypothetical protein
MMPVEMIVDHCPEEGRYGDCFRACVASLMELPAEAVPHFCDGNPGWEVFNRKLYQ